jgi:hypothetical protein
VKQQQNRFGENVFIGRKDEADVDPACVAGRAGEFQPGHEPLKDAVSHGIIMRRWAEG